MSRRATDWVWDQAIKPASAKLIMLSLADRADENHSCYPSIARLVSDTGLDRKTIIKQLAALSERGVIFDTGERKGRTCQVKVWGICGLTKAKNPPESKESQKRNSTVIPIKESQNSLSKSTAFPIKESQKRDTEPVINHPLEPVNNQKSSISSWRPSERVIHTLKLSHGVPAEFIDQEKEEFIIYWSDRNEERSSWNSKFLTRVVDQWEKKSEQWLSNPINLQSITTEIELRG